MKMMMMMMKIDISSKYLAIINEYGNEVNIEN